MTIHILGGKKDDAPPQAGAAPVMRCPQCGTERPNYGFHLNASDLGVAGTASYMTIFCGAEVNNDGEKPRSCGCIFSVAIIAWQPPQRPEDLAALQSALRGGKPA